MRPGFHAPLKYTRMDTLIAGLNAQATFGIRKVISYVAERLKLSRATIDNRLPTVRQHAKSKWETN